jgi:hypothetical protein
MTPEEELRQMDEQLEQQIQAQEAAAPPAPEPQPLERPEGLLTQIGKGIDYAISGDWVNDALDAVAPDVFMSNEELEARKTARRAEVVEEGSFFDKALYGTSENVEAVAEGAQAGLMLPLTIGANVANQEAPWSTAPERMKDSAVATTLFEISEILAPTLLLTAVGMPQGGLGLVSGARATRAAVDAGAAQDVDQVIAGRQLARGLADLSERLGLSESDEMYKSLIEGKSLESKAFTATVAFLQSYLLEFGVDNVIAKLIPNKAPGKVTEKIAKQLGKTPEEVQAVLNNTYKNAYTSALEPEDVITPNTIGPTVIAEAEQVIATPAFLKEIQRKTGVGLDGLTSAERNYFTNLDVISEDTSLQNIVQEITKELPDLVANKVEQAKVLKRAGDWWQANKGLLNDDWAKLVENFADDFAVPFSREGLSSKEVIKLQQNIGTYMREGAMLDLRVPESYTVATMIAEEMSVKISKLATVINNLEDMGVDNTTAMEVLQQMIDKAETIMVPLRRSKRTWSLGGFAQQRQTKEGVRALDISPLDDVSVSSEPGKAFTEFSDASTGKRGTFRELMSMAKAGDKDAYRAVKMIVTQLSMGDPRSALETLEVSADIIKNNFFGGRGDWLQSLMYNVGLLSSASTQVVSAANTIIRQTAEPAALGIVGAEKALAGTILFNKELALEGRKEALYSLGQLAGGITNLHNTAWAGIKSWWYNKPITGTSRFAKKVETLAQKQAVIDRNYLAYKQVLSDQNATPDKLFFAWAEYVMQSVGNNFLTSQPTRLLMAQDSAATSTAFYGTLAGKAMIADNGKPFARNFYDLKKGALGKSGDIFKGIRDIDLLEAAKTTTFQREIPTGSDANQVDKLFGAIATAADESGILKFFAPFARISWDFLDQAFIAGVGSVPVVGGKVLSGLNPRYAKMLSGEMGPAIQMQAKGTMAAAQLFLMFGTWQAVQGNMTGKQSGNLPKDSFIVPSETTDSGFMALPYGRIQPFAAYLSINSDLVNLFRTGAISRGEYQQGLGQLIASIGENSLDQTVFTGLVNLGDLIGQGRTSASWLSDIADAFSLPFAPAFSRMIGRIGDPFSDVAFIDRGDQLTSLAASLARKQGRTASLPKITNIYTNRIQPNTPIDVSDPNDPAQLAEARRASLLNEFFYPGRIQEAYKDAPWRKLLDEVGYVVPKDFLRTAYGVPLPLNVQAELSAIIAQDGLGERLSLFYNSTGYDAMKKEVAREKKAQTPNPIPGIPAAVGRNTIASRKQKELRDMVEAMHIEAKQRALERISDPELLQRIEERKNVGAQASADVNNSEWKGMYASEAQQNTQLASQVRNILDIA